jgi:hypothetical protein
MTFKNTSDQVFQDGDLMVLPGKSFSTEEESRAEQLRTQYAWQFEETKDAKSTPTEEEVNAQALPGSVREMRNGDHVTLDADGTQDTKVGQ